MSVLGRFIPYERDEVHRAMERRRAALIGRFDEAGDSRWYTLRQLRVSRRLCGRLACGSSAPNNVPHGRSAQSPGYDGDSLGSSTDHHHHGIFWYRRAR